MHALAKLASKLPHVMAARAFEQRERDRQRAEIVETLDSIQKMRAWCDQAEPVARERLEKLNRTELGLDTPAASGEHYLKLPTPPSRLDDGEYLRVPRSRREIYGHDAAIDVPDDFDFWSAAKALVAMVLAAVAVGLWVAQWANL